MFFVVSNLNENQSNKLCCWMSEKIYFKSLSFQPVERTCFVGSVEWNDSFLTTTSDHNNLHEHLNADLQVNTSLTKHPAANS